MDARAVPAIRHALDAFEHYDRSSGDVEDAHAFLVALVALDEYLEDEPDTPHRAFIANVRQAHIRRMLERLDRLKHADPMAVLEHIVILGTTAKEDTQRVLAAQPGLRAAYQALLDRWAGEAGLPR